MSDNLSPVGKPKPEVKLVGENGNAFAVMGAAMRALGDAGYTKEEVAQYRRDAQSGDYDHLLQVTMEWTKVL